LFLFLLPEIETLFLLFWASRRWMPLFLAVVAYAPLGPSWPHRIHNAAIAALSSSALVEISLVAKLVGKVG
jgi:hypothetical protein